MNTLLLQPSDVLFFRDGRPMGGSLSGHGASWPLPTVTNAALHAALHRAALEKTLGEKVYGHDHCPKDGERIADVRKFGSLVTAGPFPVLDNGGWLFPRPLDAELDKNEKDSTECSFLPLTKGFTREDCSLPKPLKYPVANRRTPTKATPASWWNRDAWENYLAGNDSTGESLFHQDGSFAATEFTYGIGIDPHTSTQDGERFYSAHYLRLQPGCRLGLLAEAQDKIKNDPNNKRDLLKTLFPNSGTETPIIVGGQQRLCTVERNSGGNLPLPRGLTGGFANGLVKWVLLSPAIFPCIEAGTSKRGTERKAHPGGWLPTWICPDTGDVLLETVDKEERKRRRRLNSKGKGYQSNPNITATLVAAKVGKPIPVTGYALPDETIGQHGGAKPTHLAVPAGSVYYFEAGSEPDAQKLAAALNWHGDGDGTQIKNRRSTLMGEKGFGLGVCGTWEFHDGNIPT